MERSDNQTKRQTDKSIWNDLTIRQKDKQPNLLPFRKQRK